MLTIFTIPKPFSDPHIGMIQTNAIKSWLKLEPACEVILMGNEAGAAEKADELKVKHIAEIKLNQHGTPLLDSAFELARQRSGNKWLMYINSDIIVLNNLAKIIDYVKNCNKFLVVGKRRDVDLKELIDFENLTWKRNLRNTLKSGKLHEAWGVDYFIFPKNVFNNIPPFAIGRAGFDNWLIYKAKAEGYKVFDATDAIVAIHQNHNYGHMSGGRFEVFNGIEAVENCKLADYKFFTIDDTDYELYEYNGKIKRKYKIFSSIKDFKHHFMFTFPELYPSSRKIVKAAQTIKSFLNYELKK